MKKNKLGQEPAFPLVNYDGFSGDVELLQLDEKVTAGMSRRFYAACAAMQGMLANSRYSDTELNNSIPVVIKICYKVADELLSQEYNEE